MWAVGFGVCGLSSGVCDRWGMGVGGGMGFEEREGGGVCAYTDWSINCSISRQALPAASDTLFVPSMAMT